MAMQRGQQHDTPRAHLEADLEPMGEHQEESILAGGTLPGVHEAAAPDGMNRTASELAYVEDEHTLELKKKVGEMVDKQFGGDYQKTFAHYDSDADGAVGADELNKLLKDPGVGNFATRGMWVKGIIEKLDSDDDKKISWKEFESVFKAAA